MASPACVMKMAGPCVPAAVKNITLKQKKSLSPAVVPRPAAMHPEHLLAIQHNPSGSPASRHQRLHVAVQLQIDIYQNILTSIGQ